GRDHEFWWDELQRIFLEPSRLPQVLRLKVDGLYFEENLGESATYTPAQFSRHASWKASDEPPTVRQRLCKTLCDRLFGLADVERSRVMDDLRGWAGLDSGARWSHRSLAIPEVERLAGNDLVEIGAHTVTHPSLAALPLAAQREEITESRRRLEE